MIGTITALFLRIFSNPFSNVLQKHLTITGCKPFSVNFFTYTGLSIFCLPFIGIIDFSNIPLLTYKYALLGGICGAIGNGFLVKALEKGDLSLLGPINSYKSVVAMLFGIFFLKEIPDIAGIYGIFLIIYGSYFVFETQNEGFSLTLFKRRDIQYRIFALVFTAIEAVFMKHVIILSGVMVSFILTCWFGSVFSFLIVYMSRQEFLPCRKDLKELFLLLITTGIMQWSTNYVFKHMNVSYALALFQLSTILSVIFGWKFFEERHIKKKLLGSFIMITGAVILILL